MEKPDLFESQELDPYDREERCRKTIRVVLRAMVMRLLVGVLLLVAVSGSGQIRRCWGWQPLCC